MRGQSVATAESLTAGLLAATPARVAGASVVLRGGLITYVEDTKIALAGVAPQLLDAVGPVAAPTARAMAVGARQRCAAQHHAGAGHPGQGGGQQTRRQRLGGRDTLAAHGQVGDECAGVLSDQRVVHANP